MREAGAATRAGLVGFGAIGKAFAACLRKWGVAPIVVDPNQGAQREARAVGLDVRGSAAELAAEVDIVSMAVRSESELWECCLGRLGAFAGAHPRTRVLVHTTMNPTVAVRLGGEADGRGIALAEAPVLGTAATVEAGHGGILVAGDPAVFDAVRDYVGHLAEEVLYVGPMGCAAVTKLVRNLMSGSERLVLAEASRVAAKVGMDPPALFRAIERMSSSHTAAAARWEEVFETAGGGDYTVKSNTRIHLFAKDIPMLAAFVATLGVDAPLLTAIASAAIVVASGDAGGTKDVGEVNRSRAAGTDADN